MSSYAYFGTPTCRQAAMQDCWRLEATAKQCVSEKAAAKKYYLSVVSSLTYCIYASTLSHQLNTFVSWLVYKWACQNGRNCLLFIYSCSHEKHLRRIGLRQRKWLLQQDLYIQVYVLVYYKIYKSCWSSHLRWRRAIRLAPISNIFQWRPPYGSIRTYTPGEWLEPPSCFRATLHNATASP